MISQDHLRTSLMRYLTGKLSADESAQFEEQLLADQEFSDAAAACEQDLIDGYALNSLDAMEGAAIRAWIEASPRRMQRVKMARALLTKKPQRIPIRWQIAATVAAAACILAAIGTTLFLTKRPIGTPSTAAAPAVAPSNPGPSPTVPKTSQIILLVAERIRGEQQIATHTIAPALPIEIQVLVPQETALSGYSLTISSLDNGKQVHLEQNDLQAQSAQGRLYLSATFAPDSLPPGRYRASVSRGEDTLIALFAVKP